MMRSCALVLCFLVACKKAPEAADPEFSDALTYMFKVFEAEPGELAFATRDLEETIRGTLDFASNNVNDRSVEPERLTSDDLEELAATEREPTDCLPVAVAALSAFDVFDQTRVQMLADHTPVEPYSPDYYDRTWTEGRDCWQDQTCEFMRTRNDLTKDNLLMTVDYHFFKDFRWIDLGLPDPSDPDAEPGPERLAFIGRSWTTDSFEGRQGNAYIHQSYTMEVWIPDDETGGTLRMLSLWSETDVGLDVNDNTVQGTTKSGIDRNFKAAEKWLEDNAN